MIYNFQLKLLLQLYFFTLLKKLYKLIIAENKTCNIINLIKNKKNIR